MKWSRKKPLIFKVGTNWRHHRWCWQWQCLWLWRLHRPGFLQPSWHKTRRLDLGKLSLGLGLPQMVQWESPRSWWLVWWLVLETDDQFWANHPGPSGSGRCWPPYQPDTCECSPLVLPMNGTQTNPHHHGLEPTTHALKYWLINHWFFVYKGILISI